MGTNFDETRFPEKVDFGVAGGPEFFTSIVATAGGNEQRNINWEDARHRFNATHGLKSQTELDEIRDFFFARRGRAKGFRFRDWTDYCSDMPGIVANIPSALDDLPAAGVLTAQRGRRSGDDADGVGDGVEVDFQLVKRYLAEARTGVFDSASGATLTFNENSPAADTIVRSAGSWITDGFQAGDTIFVTGTSSNNGTYTIDTVVALTITLVATDDLADASAVAGAMVFGNRGGLEDYVRDITKPVSGAVRAYEDGVEQANISVDTTTGIVTFDVAPSAGVVVTFDYLFDVPVRFNVDRLSAELEHFNIHEWQAFELVEVRELT